MVNASASCSSSESWRALAIAYSSSLVMKELYQTSPHKKSERPGLAPGPLDGEGGAGSPP
jgi:hypothetical protein